jgi:hypothetical protein
MPQCQLVQAVIGPVDLALRTRSDAEGVDVDAAGAVTGRFAVLRIVRQLGAGNDDELVARTDADAIVIGQDDEVVVMIDVPADDIVDRQRGIAGWFRMNMR